MSTVVCTEDEVIEYQGKEILALPMIQNEADAPTIGDYLKELMWLLFAEGECFNPKNPFGKDYWESPLYKTLIFHCCIEGTVDEYGCWSIKDLERADEIIFEAIESMC
jgi:hypothetical protein